MRRGGGNEASKGSVLAFRFFVEGNGSLDASLFAGSRVALTGDTEGVRLGGALEGSKLYVEKIFKSAVKRTYEKLLGR